MITQSQHTKSTPGPAYLGDGVYADNDGYQIWLAVNDASNVQVALELNVLKRLISYGEAMYGKAALEKL
jgi:hypothetical protein